MDTSIAIAVIAHEIPDRPPFRITTGDDVDVGERDTEWPAFVFTTSRSGSGWVPARHLAIDGGSGVAIADYDTTELPTTTGERLVAIIHDVESEWTWCRNDTGREGWVPDRTLRLPGDHA